ncbi:MAG TPA: glycoside hydrolase family 38 C-terminal domain-containing protein [Acidimicrobiales bacterium]|nr:glycoside hydrolase family 38 C-terminal domain-containing protein [Acidimicrobiales bacterium]
MTEGDTPTPRTAPRRVAIVPHTHWDREWYAPFQTFRLRLVDLLDEFLPLLDTDLGYARFLLDGQMAVVDDYLEVRPAAEASLRRLGASGRMAMGPWYVLMDEFGVSGETIVRNLQLGMERAAAFGGAADVGYLPDMFGHIAQMPQILRHAGFDHAVVWRGVPAAVDRSAFRWSAPDGSTVRAEYLLHGYGNGAAIPDDAKALLARIATHEAAVGTFLLDGMLLMNGTDHQVPQPWLGRVVAEANGIQDDYRLEVTSLAEYLAAAPGEGLAAWSGELRSGARANLLMGVASNRVDVKQAAARTERALERLAEPLSALWVPPAAWPASLLALAWKEVIRNSAHDSICACSADEVGAAVLHRFAEARQIAEGLTERALVALSGSMADAGPVVVNPSARRRGGLVELTVPGEGDLPGAQVVEERRAVLLDRTVRASDLGRLLAGIRSQQLDPTTYVNAVEAEETDRRLDVVLHADARLRTEFLVEPAKRDLQRRADARPDTDVRVRILQPPSRRVLARVDDVPGYGWAAWAPGRPPAGPVRAEGATTLANGLVRVDVDPADGTFSLDGLAGFDRLVDSGDHGDTYNWSPPENDVVVDRPEAVAVELVEGGPVRGRLRIVRTFTWPERIDDATRSRTGARTVAVTTVVEVRADERLVRVHTTFDNPCRDHRLRVQFPLPQRSTCSRAECAFAVVERGLEAEGGPTEVPLPTFPSRRFVQAGGLTVVHEGLLEYELVGVEEGTAGALALTLLRATGMLSRVEMLTRPLPAGPPDRLEGPQMLGPVEARYAVHVGEGDPYALADDAFLPLLVVDAAGGGHRPPTGTGLAVEGAEVSAVRRVGGTLEVRVFNPTASPTTMHVDGRSGWVVDLRGRPLAPFDGSVQLDPWAFATLHLD